MRQHNALFVIGKRSKQLFIDHIELISQRQRQELSELEKHIQAVILPKRCGILVGKGGEYLAQGVVVADAVRRQE